MQSGVNGSSALNSSFKEQQRIVSKEQVINAGCRGGQLDARDVTSGLRSME